MTLDLMTAAARVLCDVMTLDLKNVYPPQHGFISIMYSVTVSGS